jgi:hypothetical protein
MLIAVLFAYFSLLLPARSRFQRAQVNRDELQKQIRNSTEGVKTGSDQEAAIQQINQSLERFESDVLAPGGSGRVALYTELNELIRQNNLRNTSGPVYVALDPLGANGKPVAQSSTKSGNAKWQSMYPGIGVTVTVEGQYQNVRHFIRDIEASEQFLVINGVQLEKAADVQSPVTGPADGPTAGVPGAKPAMKTGLVSLQLDMTTYFQRDASNTNDATTSAPRRAE